MNVIKLKNGSEEVEPMVKVTMMILHNLITESPILFYELVMKARDRAHEFFGTTGEELERRNLLEAGGSMHSSIRNIILSAVEGDMLEMKLGSPVAKGGQD